MVRARPLILALALTAIALVAFGGCGSKSGGSGFATGGSSGGASSGGGSSGTDPSSSGGGSSGSTGASSGLMLGGSSGSTTPVCTSGQTGWKCKVDTSCASPTTLTGKVYDPAGKNPLYNIAVFIPNDPSTLPVITHGTKTCNTCDVPIGNYVTATQTDASGSFTLKGVPVGTGVPITIQVGKWRRTVPVDIKNDCAANTVTGNALSLPSKRSEGDMPQMALLTGGLDNLGCFLSDIGIDASEFDAPHAGGRLDVYQGVSAPLGVMIGTGPGLSNGGTAGDCTTSSCPLWSSVSSLEAYDLVLLACEGDTYMTSKTAAQIGYMHSWLDEGGKVFATHFHYVWFQSGPADFTGTATWKGTSLGTGMGTYDLDSSFPKGLSYKQWLTNVGVMGASAGTIALNGVADSVGAVNSTAPQGTLRWIYDPSNNDDTKYLSFDTPIGGVAIDGGGAETKGYCGKVVFSDLHAGGAPTGDLPGACTAGALSDQEKALEFLFFDLSACVQDDKQPVVDVPPPQ